MKKIEACKMNHLEKTITMTKKFYNAASILNTPEYVELMTILKEHPDYGMVVRKIAKAEGKKTYRNLTYKHMERLIKATDRRGSRMLSPRFGGRSVRSQPLAMAMCIQSRHLGAFWQPLSASSESGSSQFQQGLSPQDSTM